MCNCGNKARKAGQITGYEFTDPNGVKKVFLTQTEAKIAARIAKGGVIVPVVT